MKRAFIFLSVFIFWTASLPFTNLQAQTIIDQGTCGDSLTWVYTSDSTLTISGQGDMYNYGTAPWDSYKTIITTVIIGDSVTNIGNYAFNRCSLVSVTIPNSVITIGNFAFYYCLGLKSVIIPNSVITIGNGAFYYCLGLKSVIIPNSVITIGNGAFQNSGLTSITIPNSVITIGDGAFVSYNGFGGYYMNYNFIICEATTPPVINQLTFGDGYGTTPIYVPCNSFNVYKTADHWKNFTNFIGMSDTVFIFDTICHGTIYNDNGFNIHNGEGIYYRTATTSNNCSSVFCLTLSEYPFVPITHYSATVCWDKAYSDDNFTNVMQSGTYYHTLQNINGCDSIICLTLSKHSVVPVANYSATICMGNVYSDDNFTNLTRTGDYYDTLQSIYDCDSIIELALTVNPIYFVSDTITISQGETYNFFGKLLTEQGIYYDTLQTINGCDSIFELNLMYETSIVERQLLNIRIYPNPTTGQLTIKNGQLTIDNIEMFDIMGRQLPLPLERAGGEVKTDISHLPTGIYLLKIETQTGSTIHKIIKY